MSAIPQTPFGDERRKFPRIQASCPVRYVGQVDGGWHDGELCDYSATGVRMVCDNTLLQSTEITLELVPGHKSRVPSISANAIVVRCGLRDDHRYEIACKLIKVRRN